MDLAERDILDAEFALAPQSGFASDVEVVAPAPAPSTSPSATPVAPRDVLKTAGAVDNVFRTLHTLPGVAATQEFSSRITVRGGAPDQNLTVMDGVEIHDPFRLFGLASAFNPEIIQHFELATSGFTAKYGDRLSSLLVDREPRRRPLAPVWHIRIAEHHRCQRRLRRQVARPRARLVARHRPPHVVRPDRRPHHRFQVSAVCRPPGESGVGASRRGGN